MTNPTNIVTSLEWENPFWRLIIELIIESVKFAAKSRLLPETFSQSPSSSTFYRIICHSWRLIRWLSSKSLQEKK